jgi:hypothetical protein
MVIVDRGRADSPCQFCGKPAGERALVMKYSATPLIQVRVEPLKEAGLVMIETEGKRSLPSRTARSSPRGLADPLSYAATTNS